MTATIAEPDLDLLDFPADIPSCENEHCAFGNGPVKARTWFEPVCRCGVVLVCNGCAVAIAALLHQPCPMYCRDCGKAYPTGIVADHVRLEPISA